MGSQQTFGNVAEIDNESQPWLDSNGRIHSDEVIKQISRNWSPDTWTRFLDATVDRYEPDDDEIFDETSGSELNVLVRRLIRDHCTPIQRQVLRMTFWENKSGSEIARTLGVIKQRVSTVKLESLKKLKGLLEGRVDVFTKGRGTNKTSTQGDIQNVTSPEPGCVGTRSDLC